ncbi:ATP-binding protein [Kribbella capetownensis]|uniref:ATP-binding protein n=2 Tax=Kribbella capetownensis TaxID=1572659 RepID=A0A4R0K1J7_9ACTN|nr:ATP-binding protein [Kribbella capetownensis]
MSEVRRFLLQMSGVPGSGKSTIARHVGSRYGAIVVDLDVIRSAVLDGGVPAEDSGRAAYPVMYALTRSLLDQGFSVVIDSPCQYDEIIATGREIAHERGVAYKYVECRTDDLTAIDNRLGARVPMRSQRRGVSVLPVDLGGADATGEQAFRGWLHATKRPVEGYLQVEATESMDLILKEVGAYLELGQVAR